MGARVVSGGGEYALTWLPSVSNSCAFPPVDGAPVLAGVKQIAVDAGCESALGRGGGNGPGNGWGGRRWRA
jgi:hypothetical protein